MRSNGYPFILLLFILFSTIGFGQQDTDVVSTDSLDNAYREDQIYFGITYNLLKSLPDGMTQTGFSSGFHIGFIRDFPINTRRNLAIGIGLGYSTNSVNHNLLIQKQESGGFDYSIGSSEDFTKNKFSMQFIEVPLEFRWRSSTAEVYKFWRVYAGFKVGYLLRSVVKYEGEPKDYKLTQIDDFSDFEYGFTLSAGYDKFNIHLYYALNRIFEDNAAIEGESLDLSAVKIGLMLYIL